MPETITLDYELFVEEWFKENECSACDHLSPACFEMDKIVQCMEYAIDADMRRKIDAAWDDGNIR